MPVEKAVMLGTGVMGLPMALRLAEKGFEVHAIVRSNADRAAELSRAGVQVHGSIAEISIGAVFYVLALPTRMDQLDNLHEAETESWALATGSIVVDCSTIAPQAAVELRESLSASGIGYIECPVSGGPMGARDGSLTGLVVGEDDVLSRARRVLDALLGRQIFTGGPGSAQTMKLLNNMILAANMAANAEALSVARRHGLDMNMVREVVLASSGSNWQMANIVPKTILRDVFDPLYSLDNLVKDLSLFEEISQADDLPVSSSVIGRYRAARAAFGGGADFSSVYRLHSR